MPDDRFVFEPVYDLRSARVQGFEVVPRRETDAIAHRARAAGWNVRQIAEVDAGTVLSAVALARRYDPAAPLQVDVAADTAVLARDRLRGVLDGVGVAPMLEIGPAVTAVREDELVDALAELRAWGFRIALDGIGRGFGLGLIDVVRPDVVKLEPDAGPGGNAAVVRAVCAVAATVGTRVAATGIGDPGRLTELHAAGVGLAQGPALGEGGPRPVPDPAGAPALLWLVERPEPVRASATDTAVRPSPRPRAVVPPPPEPIRTLAAAAVTVPDDAAADTVRSTLGEHPDAGGVVLVDRRRRPTGYLDRSRFLLAMAGPFGHALWANKPARDMADPPRIADERTPLPGAMQLSLSGDPARGYDDLVLVGPDGGCTGVVPVSELWRRALRTDPQPAERPAHTPQPAQHAIPPPWPAAEPGPRPGGPSVPPERADPRRRSTGHAGPPLLAASPPARSGPPRPPRAGASSL